MLATVAAVGATSVAGCSVLDADGGTGVPPAQVFSEEVARVTGSSDADPTVERASVERPARIAGIDGLPDRILGHPLTDYDGDVERTDVDVRLELDQFAVDVGSFSSEEAASAWSPGHDAREVETELDATVWEFWEFVHNVYVFTDGVFIRFVLEGTEAETPTLATRIERKVEPILAAIDGAGGGSLFDTGATAALSNRLGDGFYVTYWDLGSDTPMGLAVARTGDLARRRIVQFRENGEAAATSPLLDEKLRSEIAARDYQFAEEDLDPFQDVAAQRDGRVVTTEVTLPLDRLVVQDFEYPPTVTFDPSPES